MGNNTTWEVYLKIKELTSVGGAEVMFPIATIASLLSIEDDIAMECAIVLHKLGLIVFDAAGMLIGLPLAE